MKLFPPLLFLALLLAGPAVHADLFTKTASDPAIKMLHFPQSLAVIQNRPAPAGGRKVEAGIDSILNDRRAFRILRKVDPARIAPAMTGEDFHGAVTRPALAGLGKKYDVDILFLFRREILEVTQASLKIRTRGLVYLVRQKKIVTVPANETTATINAGNREENIRKMNEAALQELAQAARRQIHSHKFEKRQSAY